MKRVPVRVDMGLVSDNPFSGVLSLLDESDDMLLQLCSVWFAICKGSDPGWLACPAVYGKSVWLPAPGGKGPAWCRPCGRSAICEFIRSPSNKPSRIIRSFWATSGGGGGGLSLPAEVMLITKSVRQIKNNYAWLKTVFNHDMPKLSKKILRVMDQIFFFPSKVKKPLGNYLVSHHKNCHYLSEKNIKYTSYSVIPPCSHN